MWIKFKKTRKVMKKRKKNVLMEGGSDQGNKIFKRKGDGSLTWEDQRS